MCLFYFFNIFFKCIMSTSKIKSKKIEEPDIKEPIREKEVPQQVNIILANLIYVFHICVILFVLFAPFTNIPALLILHITFSFSLMVHWAANSNACSLTLIESYFRNTDVTDTFTHSFISPIYDISSTEWNNIVWIITIIVMCISLYKLINNQIFNEVLLKLRSSNFQNFFTVIQPLFIL